MAKKIDFEDLKMPRAMSGRQRCAWPGGSGGYFVTVVGDQAVVQVPVEESGESDRSRWLSLVKVPMGDLYLHPE